ncbi:MAG: hypothetical protein V1750_04080, partial [Acidobacteriota bacterium]
LWRRAAGRYPVAAVRDGEWISRRFTGHPRLAYTHVSAWRRGQACAWAVVCPLGGTLRWVELIWDGEDRGALAALDRGVCRAARAAGCTAMEMWLRGDEDAQEALAERGWERGVHPENLQMVMCTFHERVDPTEIRPRLYLTMGDSDLA